METLGSRISASVVISTEMVAQPHDNVKIGDLVLIVDENSPHGCWPLGLVVEVIQERDGLVRSVKMRSKGKLVVRPITEVVFLEGSQ